MAIRAIPAQTIYGTLWSVLFQHDAYCVGESYRVMGRVGRKEEHLAFTDDDVPEFAFVDDFQYHGAFVLVEPFSGFVDVVVGACIWASYYLQSVRIRPLGAQLGG